MDKQSFRARATRQPAYPKLADIERRSLRSWGVAAAGSLLISGAACSRVQGEPLSVPGMAAAAATDNGSASVGGSASGTAKARISPPRLPDGGASAPQPIPTPTGVPPMPRIDKPIAPDSDEGKGNPRPATHAAKGEGKKTAIKARHGGAASLRRIRAPRAEEKGSE